MSMDKEEQFDVLSLFTPQSPKTKSYGNESYISKEHAKPKSEINTFNTELIDEDEPSPIHVLDLPALAHKPPGVVLIVILKLLAPGQQYNFSALSVVAPTETPQEIFESRNIDVNLIDECIPWLSIHCPLLSSSSKLSSFSKMSGSLHQTSQYMNYLTQIISSELNWVLSEDDIEIIRSECSLRIAESCGRTAHPDFKRKIVIDKIQEVTSREFIWLKEPSLTNDNLGLKTWGSSFILGSRLICTHKEKKLLKSPVLELGSGTGLVGIISCLLGYETVLTDLAAIVPNLATNCEINDLGDNCDVLELDWCDSEPFKQKYKKHDKFNTIILSDPIYSPDHPYLVQKMISEFLSLNKDARVLLQIPIRETYEKERTLVWQLMEDMSLQEVFSDLEDGFDDFGEQKFIFKVYKWLE